MLISPQARPSIVVAHLDVESAVKHYRLVLKQTITCVTFNPLPVRPNTSVWFFDFETFVNENNKHIPFLVYAKTLKGEEKVFYGLDCVKHFLLYFRRVF